MTPRNFLQLSNFIWSVADLLRGPYRPPQYERVMLPLTVLRRFDAVLALTKQNVSLHIKNILKDGELPEAATVTESLTVQNEGSRRV